MLHVSALVLGHVLGNKSAELGPFIFTLTVLSFPITFLTTDLLNERWGRSVARRVTVMSVLCVVLAFGLIEIARQIPAASGTHLPLGAFEHVLAVPAAHVLALLSGYVCGQLADIQVFHRVRKITGSRLLWVRVVSSTAIGEAVDGVTVSAFLVAAPTSVVGATPVSTLLHITWDQAVVRMALMLALLPMVYFLHRTGRYRR
ncbi:MAG: queuosine precursor transporter [Steroidobacteraceae bacterium]